MAEVRDRVLGDFAGAWDVTRRVIPRAGPHARFEGRAVWQEAPGGLRYAESGMMTLEGHAPMQAERRYFWGEDLSVYFDDGRFFHRVPAAGGEVMHRCNPDDYLLAYDFSRWPAFTVAWRVSGPRKDYRAETEYRRR